MLDRLDACRTLFLGIVIWVVLLAAFVAFNRFVDHESWTLPLMWGIGGRGALVLGVLVCFYIYARSKRGEV